MKKRVKLLTTIASLCLAVALMAFGVYAATTISAEVNSTISFTSSDIAGKWEVTVTGAGTLAKTTVIDSSASTDDEVSGDQDVALTFSKTVTSAEYTITFTNTGTANAATVNLEVELSEHDAFSYTVKMDGSNYAADKSVAANNGSVTYVVTVTLDTSKLSATELANGIPTSDGLTVKITGTATA